MLIAITESTTFFIELLVFVAFFPSLFYVIELKEVNFFKGFAPVSVILFFSFAFHDFSRKD